MASPQTLPRPKTSSQNESQPLRAWNVVLLDDDDHTYDYVIRMAQTVFGHTAGGAMEIARTVDRDGRAVLATTHKERAELKRDQVHSFGPDPLIASCAGAMSAIIEPVDGAGGDDADRRPGA